MDLIRIELGLLLELKGVVNLQRYYTRVMNFRVFEKIIDIKLLFFWYLNYEKETSMKKDVDKKIINTILSNRGFKKGERGQKNSDRQD
ncbi:hypothetical protein BH10BAC4_BH10BAC4_22830 [soil metagenome]